ncbi:hypothetical protein HZY91_04845 [Facklamia sp. DSM 111018]|uniref:Uncharacterized protein n=1 Tax=Facklamia lactis TaxID=2749967 RepID=A0ABS0LRY7_9LACT|nr:hypothetical protein [Facklamia lactis]
MVFDQIIKLKDRIQDLIYDEDKLIGTARLVSDGVLNVQMFMKLGDIMVLAQKSLKEFVISVYNTNFIFNLSVKNI